LQTIKEKAVVAKVVNYQNYEKWMERGIIKADQIILNQERDLKAIEEVEAKFLERCDAIERELELKVQDEIDLGNQREKLIYRKLEMLIGDISAL
jgi:hypothetical protein